MPAAPRPTLSAGLHNHIGKRLKNFYNVGPEKVTAVYASHRKMQGHLAPERNWKMTTDLREHSRLASSGIKMLAAAARQDVADQLRQMRENLPDGFQQLSTVDRRNVIENLQVGLIAWSTEIEPLAGELRSLLRQLFNELADATTGWRDPDMPLMDEEDMPWTQSARDRKVLE
jgi:hypothetical protein